MPLGVVVAGFALVVLDLRVDGFDLASDLLGWILAALGASRLARSSGWFAAAAAAAAVGALLGVPAQFAEPTGLLRDLGAVVETGFVFATCSGVAAAARSVARIRTTALRIRWIDLGLTLAAVVLGESGTPPAAAIVVLALAALGVAAWFMIFLLSVRDHPTLRAGGPAYQPGH